MLCSSMTSSLNISKDLDQALLRPLKPTMTTEQDHDKLMAYTAVTEPVRLKVPKSTLTETFAFADGVAYNKP